jgi:uncharacterized alkaline shock family protein YloU
MRTVQEDRMTTSVDKPNSPSKTSNGNELSTSQGQTTIADAVVSKIAGIAARDVSGVYELGGSGGTAKAFSAVVERIPGASQSASQGVSVEVGEREAAIDLDVIVEFGVAIADLSQAIRKNVISSVERMTGLDVTEVNISVNDIHLPSDDKEPEEPARVQ